MASSGGSGGRSPQKLRELVNSSKVRLNFKRLIVVSSLETSSQVNFRLVDVSLKCLKTFLLTQPSRYWVQVSFVLIFLKFFILF